MSIQIKRPNFFIIGAPRCGTASLNTYLSEHPQIFMPRGKEFHYFADDFVNLQKIRFANAEEYLQLFRDAPEGVSALGDASPFHLFSKTALQKIKDFDPQAKIIVTLRNPLDFARSLHQLNVSLMRDDEVDFSKAWALQSARKEGRFIPKSARHMELLMYGELGLFGKYLEKVYAVFPREQVKVILLDDIREDTRAVYEDILFFLSVSSDGRTNFLHENEGFQSRNRWVAWLLHPPQPIMTFTLKMLSLFGVRFTQRIKLLHYRTDKLNNQPSPRVEIDPVLKAELREYFKADIMKLSGLIERDLSKWLEE
jgi:hypothetical protein